MTVPDLSQSQSPPSATVIPNLCCGVKRDARHIYEFHGAATVQIDSQSVEVTRKNDKLNCPIAGCSSAFPRRSNFTRHIRDKHANTSAHNSDVRQEDNGSPMKRKKLGMGWFFMLMFFKLLNFSRSWRGI
jgi:hypothetical protein